MVDVATAGQNLKSGNLLGSIGLGGFNVNMGTLGTILLVILISLLVFGGFIALFYWWYMRRTYSQTIWIFGLIGGVPMFKGQDKGKYIPFGATGDRLMHFRVRKKYVSPPTIQMGKHLWWYWERSDGELINIGLKDIDEQMRKVGAYFTDTDMRMTRLGIEKNLRERLEKQSFWAKYGTMIAGAIFVILVTISLVVLFSKIVDVAKAMDNMAQSVNAMANQIQAYYEKRIGSESPADKGGTTGLIPALLLPMVNNLILTIGRGGGV